MSLPYDPKTLKNIPRYVHEAEAEEKEQRKLLPPKPPEKKKVDVTALLKKWGHRP